MDPRILQKYLNCRMQRCFYYHKSSDRGAKFEHEICSNEFYGKSIADKRYKKYHKGQKIQCDDFRMNITHTGAQIFTNLKFMMEKS